MPPIRPILRERVLERGAAKPRQFARQSEVMSPMSARGDARASRSASPSFGSGLTLLTLAYASPKTRVLLHRLIIDVGLPSPNSSFGV